VWVDPGKTLRESTFAEAAQFRANRAKLESPLPSKEIPGVIERMPRSEVWTSAVRFELLGRARELCVTHC
jgi:hypothetical protein